MHGCAGVSRWFIQGYLLTRELIPIARLNRMIEAITNTAYVDTGGTGNALTVKGKRHCRLRDRHPLLFRTKMNGI